ncbi:hypothetical protein Q31a_19480 [Aureliella helgolandensis]|uniref:Uncharacterized protein n=1 Tax=Aureliella helgolandensis TaxID=2527968 RepID=A0A518G4X4_9BACT|nr:hypothetical protein Q31a_19480 [Aureliella helgolandensis]
MDARVILIPEHLRREGMMANSAKCNSILPLSNSAVELFTNGQPSSGPVLLVQYFALQINDANVQRLLSSCFDNIDDR